MDAKPQTAMTNIILKTADPMTPLTPISSLARNTPMTTVANSGAELPAAINVAPATSGLTLSSEKIKKLKFENYDHFQLKIYSLNWCFKFLVSLIALCFSLILKEYDR